MAYSHSLSPTDSSEAQGGPCAGVQGNWALLVMDEFKNEEDAKAASEDVIEYLEQEDGRTANQVSESIDEIN